MKFLVGSLKKKNKNNKNLLRSMTQVNILDI